MPPLIDVVLVRGGLPRNLLRDWKRCAKMDQCFELLAVEVESGFRIRLMCMREILGTHWVGESDFHGTSRRDKFFQRRKLGFPSKFTDSTIGQDMRTSRRYVAEVSLKFLSNIAEQFPASCILDC